MSTTPYLTNHFLIAMPQLADPNFYHSASYICEHNEDGAMGLIITRPTELTLDEVLEHMEITINDPMVSRIPVYFGGPVQQERGFVLHTPASSWDATLKITDEIALTTSRDILQEIAEGNGPERYLVALGYAGWAPGQLEKEMLDNAWLSGLADVHTLFEIAAEDRWSAAAAALGVDLNLISGETGHA